MVPVFKENDPADNDIVKKIAVFENTIYGKISNSSLQRIPNDYFARVVDLQSQVHIAHRSGNYVTQG